MVTTATGSPGAPAKIRIRGTASLNGPQDPLWVIDGMSLEGSEVPDFSSKDNIDQLKNFSIAGLNPNDIADITILKDAAATAIYGARAANGVISITTKKGKKGKMRINFSANTFFNFKPDFSKLNLLNASEKVDLELMLASRSDLTYRSDKGAIARLLNASGELNTFRLGGLSALSPATQAAIKQLRSQNTSWGDLLYRSTFNQQYGVSVSGGGEDYDYYLSLGYYKEEGTTVGTGFERYNITLKNNYQITDKLHIGAALFGTQAKKKSFLSDRDASINPANYSRNANPYLKPYNADGSYNYDQDIDGFDDRYVAFNFLEERENTNYQLETNSLKAIFDLDYDLFEGLTLSSQLGLQLDDSRTEKYAGSETYYVRKETQRTRYYDSETGTYKYFLPEGGIIENPSSYNFQYNWKTMAKYNATFNYLHEIDVMIGSELRRTYAKNIESRGFGYDPKTMTTKPIFFPNESAANSSLYETYRQSEIKNAYASFFGTASYTFDRKYTFFGSVRFDGSNLFGVDPKYRYLLLWSVSGAWQVSEEDFMKNVEFINYLRLRASYGLQGNIDRNTSSFVVGEYGNSILLPGVNEETIVVTSPPNSTLRWEKTANTNIGFDLSMFNDRVSVGFDAYHRKGTDLIGLRQLPLETGFEFTTMNWAQITNEGYEISVTTRNISTPEFSWRTTINLSHNKSNVDRINVQNSDFLPSREGLPVNAMFVIKTAGLDDQGNLMFWKGDKKVSAVEFFKLYDAMADVMPGYLVNSGLTNEEYRELFTYAGDRDPKFTGGIINTFKWNNFDLTISANFNLKQMVIERPPYNPAEVDPGRNYTKAILNAWSPSNPNGTLPAISSANPAQGEAWMVNKWFGGMDAFNSYNYLDIWAKEMSYIRISSIRLGYSFPESWLEKLKMQNARIFVEGRNLFVFGTNYDGYFDPETYGNIYAQPISRAINMGFNVTF